MSVGAEPADEVTQVVDLGRVAILPGLVNAHTHLEFSDLPRPLGEPGIRFADWIRLVVDLRRRTAATPRDSIRLGLEECLRSGTTTLGEIATSGWTAKPVAGVPLEATAFLELLSLAADRVEPLLALARSYVERLRSNRSSWRPGISPHAPYSTRPELVAAAAWLSAEAGVPLAMHVAESREELQLLRDGSGPLCEVLVELGAWDAAAIPHGARPLDYLRTLSTAQRALVIHGNYLNDEEVACLAEHRARMSVVYCPRTHRFFGHPRYPLLRLLQAGVNVALGTDSRASNPDLSLLAEMRCVAREFPELSPRRVLELGTLCGAAALGCDDRLGTLAPGKDANLAIVALPDEEAEPHRLVLDSDTDNLATIYRGRVVYSRFDRLAVANAH